MGGGVGVIRKERVWVWLGWGGFEREFGFSNVTAYITEGNEVWG